jgi:hypothetical protein
MVVIIEHKLPDASRVVSVYGHLSNRDGMRPKLSGEVHKGDVIGHVGHSGGTSPKKGCKDDDENGDGDPHLHLGLRKGGPPGGWVFYGYKHGAEDLESRGGKWVSAQAFIESHRATAPPPPQQVVSPAVSVQPGAGAIGTTFQQNGHGFSPNSPVRLFFQYPNNKVDAQVVKQTDGSGRFNHSYTRRATDQRGRYLFWALDVKTSKESARIGYMFQ